MTRKARLNPTANGDLHIGHIYNAYVNRAMSDKLILRFDDNQREWRDRLGAERIAEICSEQLGIFEWFGFQFCDIQYATKMEPSTLRWLVSQPHFRWVPNHYDLIENAKAEWIGDPQVHLFGPLFFILPEKVAQDFLSGVNVLVRGHELVTEDSLYCWLCIRLGAPYPKRYYIPRLRCYDGGELTDMSKTRGNYKVKEFQERGWTAADIEVMLRLACLKEAGGDWTVDNIKDDPRLGERDGT